MLTFNQTVFCIDKYSNIKCFSSVHSIQPSQTNHFCFTLAIFKFNVISEREIFVF